MSDVWLIAAALVGFGFLALIRWAYPDDDAATTPPTPSLPHRDTPLAMGIGDTSRDGDETEPIMMIEKRGERDASVLRRYVIEEESCNPRIYLPLTPEQRAALKRHFRSDDEGTPVGVEPSAERRDSCPSVGSPPQDEH